MDSILDIVLVTSLVTHAILIVYLLMIRRPTRYPPGGLLLPVVFSLVAYLIYWLPQNVLSLRGVNREFIAAMVLAAMLISYGRYVLRDLRGRSHTAWSFLGMLWLLAMGAIVLTAESIVAGREAWLLAFGAAPDAAGLVTLGGLLLMSLGLVATAFNSFYRAALPEVANRALFWVLNTAALSIGILLTISGDDLMLLIGAAVVPGALANATYAHMSFRIFDIRGGAISILRRLLFITVAALIIFVTLLGADTLTTESTQYRVLVFLVLAVLAAAIYMALSVSLGWIATIFTRPASNPARAARQYSQHVTKATDLNELISIATTTLNQVMSVRRSGVMLIDDTTQDEVTVIIRREGEVNLTGQIAKDGPIYERLAVRNLPVSQFDIDFDPNYRALSKPEREFFHGLQMSAYAPIVIEDIMIGVLMCGPKRSDAPFSASDLDLLATLADQTGVALRNARSLADLKHLNRTVMALNEELEEANAQYERLDSVKTDFITIASHELRTPLAQVRGYVDILETLNEQGMLDQDQTSGMVNNLRKAIDRTEELLTAMLDMSQLDVNAMDLRFAQVSAESVVRMAIEPLTEYIKQRKLTLSARGLRGLPMIHCDMQRLVQALRNIVTNAIKFTPDGGRIDITASLQPDKHAGEDCVLIAISDTGVGIDSDNLELVFEKFYRAYDPSLHSTGSYKFMGAGPGLGLTIAKGVIESHGGKVWAESSGHNMETFPGTTFYIILPVNPPEQARRVLIEDPMPASNDNTPVSRSSISESTAGSL